MTYILQPLIFTLERYDVYFAASRSYSRGVKNVYVFGAFGSLAKQGSKKCLSFGHLGPWLSRGVQFLTFILVKQVSTVFDFYSRENTSWLFLSVKIEIKMYVMFS